MNACIANQPTDAHPASLDVAFFESPEYDALAESMVRPLGEFQGESLFFVRIAQWPSHVSMLLGARYQVQAKDVSIATLGRLLLEDLQALDRSNPRLADELLEELIAFYAFLARVRPESNAPTVWAWLRKPATGRRVRHALGGARRWARKRA